MVWSATLIILGNERFHSRELFWYYYATLLQASAHLKQASAHFLQWS